MTPSPQPRWSGQRRLLAALVPPLAAALLRLLGATLRYEEIFDQGGEPDRRDGAALWCFWHRCLLPAACYFRGRPGTALLISPSFDGELIARTIARLGYRAVRGSSSRSGAAGLRALERAIREGATAVIPGDGPRGPRYVLKPGIARLAQLTALPIRTFYLLPLRAWVVRSWDGLLIPKPFSRVIIAWGRPLPPPARGADTEELRRAAEETLERLRALAEAHGPHRPSSAH
jgi:lysophospholipid acyltransferase (LPLAT)-like uncharacterized protein